MIFGFFFLGFFGLLKNDTSEMGYWISIELYLDGGDYEVTLIHTNTRFFSNFDTH